MKPRGGGNRNSGHRSAVLFVGGVTRGFRLSAPPTAVFWPRLRRSFKIQNSKFKISRHASSVPFFIVASADLLSDDA